jgi:MoaD family protein
MRIQMQYFAQVRQAAGRDEESLGLPDATHIRGLLAFLADRHGAAFRALVLDAAGDSRPGIIVLLNAQPVPRGELQPLSDGDRVAIFSPVAGG